MNEEFEVLRDITYRLHSGGIEYMMTGSMALAVYATPRMTRDIDLVLHVSEKNADVLIDLFKEDCYIDTHSVRDAIRDKGMFNIIHTESIVKIDCIVLKEDEYSQLAFSNRRTVDVEGVSISVIAPEDLILAKLLWEKKSGSGFQLRDVQQILAGAEKLDQDYLNTWAMKTSIHALLKKASENA
jgi:hypothetical protein